MDLRIRGVSLAGLVALLACGTTSGAPGGHDSGSANEAASTGADSGSEASDSSIDSGRTSDDGSSDVSTQEASAADAAPDACDTSNSCCCSGDVGEQLPTCGAGGALICPPGKQLYHGFDCTPACGAACFAPCDASHGG